MDIQKYSQVYEDEVVNLWNQTLKHDLISVHKFRNQILFDDNFNNDLCLIAVEGGKVVGFILGMKRKFPYLERGLEPDRGWITVLFVEEKSRRKGIASALTRHIEEALEQMGAETITLGAYSPNYIFPGIDKDNYPEAIQFFDSLHYVAGSESYSMAKDLHDYEFSQAAWEKKKFAEEAGFRFVPFTYEYALDILEFARVEFGGGWKRNLLLAMQRNVAEDTVLVVFDKNKEIVGFCMRMIDGNPMRFGPIGVKAETRNYGIGGILFDLMQLEMKKRGIYHLYFISTDAPGRRFYERHGVKLIRTFVEYRKTI